MLKAEFFNPPEAIQVHHLVQDKYGAQLDKLVRFGDFFDLRYIHPMNGRPSWGWK